MVWQFYYRYYLHFRIYRIFMQSYEKVVKPAGQFSFATLLSHLKCGSHGFQQRKHTDKTLEWVLPAQESHPVASCAWNLSWIPRFSSHWVLHTDHHFRPWYLPTEQSSFIHVTARISVWSKHSWTLGKRCKCSLYTQFTILKVVQVNKNATGLCVWLSTSFKVKLRLKWLFMTLWNLNHVLIQIPLNDSDTIIILLALLREQMTDLQVFWLND